jgi:demethylmenaquinone methyltransferase/2-methoxy-6-polyprenyl-1,4-benzoquinol methylase
LDTLGGLDEPAVDRLLAEQKRYYGARAPEYDDWWLRRDRYTLDEKAREMWLADIAELESELERFGPAGDVLELAAGTGIWTQRLVRYARRVTAVDASVDVLERNRAKVGPDAAVEYRVADLFAWEPARAYDVCFFSFWLSHVPRGRAAEFWGLVARALRPGGRVFLIDNTHTDRGDLRHTVGTGDEVARRSLADGREFTIVKRFWSTAELEDEASAFGWRLAAAETRNHHFLHASGCRAG